MGVVADDLAVLDRVLLALDSEPTDPIGNIAKAEWIQVAQMAKASCIVRLFLESKNEISQEELEDIKAILKYSYIFE